MNFLETLAPHYKDYDPWKQKAWKTLQIKGFPTRQIKEFQYVPLKVLYEARFSPLDKVNLSFEKKKNTCVFVNGEFRAELSRVDGVICLPLTKAMRSYGALFQKSWAHMIKEETNSFHILNHALYEEGLFLYIPPEIQTAVKWVFLSTKKEQIHTPKIEVHLGKRAHLTIKSQVQGEGKYWHNESINVSIDEGAHLFLEEKTSHSVEAWGFHTKRIQLGRDAKFQCKTVSKGAKVERHDISIILSGEGSEVNLKGLSLLSEKAEIHHHLFVKHERSYAHSNQHYKTVLQDVARSSFGGKIFVEKGAQKTEAYQLNNNLLLSPKAKAISKPNLEIRADDVKVTHGATSSRLKDDDMFYLKSRGLDENEAKRHLVKGFCRELFNDEVIDASF